MTSKRGMSTLTSKEKKIIIEKLKFIKKLVDQMAYRKKNKPKYVKLVDDVFEDIFGEKAIGSGIVKALSPNAMLNVLNRVGKPFTDSIVNSMYFNLFNELVTSKIRIKNLSDDLDDEGGISSINSSGSSKKGNDLAKKIKEEKKLYKSGIKCIKMELNITDADYDDEDLSTLKAFVNSSRQRDGFSEFNEWNNFSDDWRDFNYNEDTLRPYNMFDEYLRNNNSGGRKNSSRERRGDDLTWFDINSDYINQDEYEDDEDDEYEEDDNEAPVTKSELAKILETILNKNQSRFNDNHPQDFSAFDQPKAPPVRESLNPGMSTVVNTLNSLTGTINSLAMNLAKSQQQMMETQTMSNKMLNEIITSCLPESVPYSQVAQPTPSAAGYTRVIPTPGLTPGEEFVMNMQQTAQPAQQPSNNPQV